MCSHQLDCLFAAQVVYLHAEDCHTSMADAAGHSDRLANLVLQTRMVTWIVFLAQETQTVNQFFHALQPVNPTNSISIPVFCGCIPLLW